MSPKAGNLVHVPCRRAWNASQLSAKQPLRTFSSSWCGKVSNLYLLPLGGAAEVLLRTGRVLTGEMQSVLYSQS